MLERLITFIIEKSLYSLVHQGQLTHGLFVAIAKLAVDRVLSKKWSQTNLNISFVAIRAICRKFDSPNLFTAARHLLIISL